MKKRTLKNCITALILLISFGIYGQDRDYFTSVQNPHSYETAELVGMDTQFSTFANLLELSGMEFQMEFAEPFTILVPTDEAFGEMEREEFNKLKDPQNRDELIEFLKRHIIPQKVLLYDFESDQVLDAADGQVAEIDADKDMGLVYIGGAQIVGADIETADGIIHVVDNIVRRTDTMRN